MGRVSTEEWLDAVVSATQELAVTALAFEEGTVEQTSEPVPDMSMGSFAGIAGEEGAIQIGIIASHEDCISMCRAFLGMEVDEELSEEDLADCLGELVNVMIGGVKSRMSHAGGLTMKIGLPLVFRGRIEVPKNVKAMTSLIRWGSVQAYVILLHHKGGS